MKVTLGTLKDKGEELATFLEPRVGTKPSLGGGEIEIEDGNIRAGVKPRDVKTYIKRFLYMKGVRKNYRVFVSGKELTIQEIVLGEKEGEEKAEKKQAAKKEEEAKPEEPEEKPAEEAEPPEAAEEKKPEKAKKPPAKKPRKKKKDQSSDE